MDIMKYIMVSVGILAVLSILVSLTIYVTNQTSETKEAPLFWAAVLFVILCQGITGNHPIGASLAALSLTPMLLIVSSASRRRDKRGIRKITIFTTLGIALIAWSVLLGFGTPFWVYTMPLGFSIGGMYLYNVYLCLHKNNTTSEKMLYICFGFIGCHMLDYNFLRVRDGDPIVSFLVAYVIFFLMAILVPIVAAERFQLTYIARLDAEVMSATSDLNLKNEELQLAKHNVKSLVRMMCHDMSSSLFVSKNGFDYVMSHLNSIDSLLIEETENIKEVALAVKNAMKNQSDLIENVRVMQSISDGKAVLSLIPVNLSEAISAAMKLLSDQSDAKNIKVISSVSESIWIKADKSSFVNSVLVNLLSNAIKFSFEGERIEFTAAHVGKGNVSLTIRDTGLGISQENIVHIFSSTKMTSTRGTADEPGTGFGMPIVKFMLDKFDSLIDIESRQYVNKENLHGTSIHLTIPEANAPQITSAAGA